ncbi:MAG TPA: sulfatase [Thermoanaerobaculia bacterium]|nr:sulfatase [Thermoanaerobaculia bacterium]
MPTEGRRRRASGLSRAVIAVVAAAAAAALLASACPRSTAAKRPRNVVFILVDTLRADHLGVYGYRRATSPALDALARESLLFGNARSQSSCTFPSVNSMLTSRYPSAFLAQPGGAMGLPAGVPGLAEILRARGFSTVAISASPVVRRSPGRFNPLGGFGRGFDLFREECVWRHADCVTRQAVEQLRPGPRPLLLYLHFMDPHGPYGPPPPYPRRWAVGHPDKEFIRRGDPNPIGDWLYKGAPDPRVTPADLRYLEALYDDSIAFFDSQLALLLARLRASGLYDDSILVLAADHGEEFMEHGHVKHCRTVFDTSVHTPLLFHVPGVAPRRSEAPVQNLDIVPTLLDYLGIPTAGPAGPAAAGPRVEGRSLRPAIEGGAGAAAAGPEIYQWSAQGALRGVSDGRLKLVHDLATHQFSLYDLARDPGETHDALREHRRDFQRLRQALAAWLARTEGPAIGETMRRSEAADRRLRSLGYLD